MNDLRTAAQQALEALEAMQSYAAAERKGLRICDEAIPALRAALAQQAEPVEPVEPVAVVATQSDVWRGYNGQWAPPGEPIKMVQMLRDLPMGTLLYTAPPQRKPLTEEEIYRATGHCGVSKYTAIAITRAVERAHGIKE